MFKQNNGKAKSNKLIRANQSKKINHVSAFGLDN